jgi:ssDNA thymidine ADP-ribosyltransferase, DarT
MTTPVYHITSVKNLPLILSSGGLMAKSKLTKQDISYTDIAHQSIQDRRAQIIVPSETGGMLHDYVPFYFAPRSPMLYAIHCGSVQGYEGGQNQVIHLRYMVEDLANAKIPFVFTDGHAAMKFSRFYDDLDSLSSAIDWPLMRSNFWADTPEDGDRKRRRQAEFLVNDFCPWEIISEIGVQNSQIQQQVEEMLSNSNHSTPVKVYAGWYY